MSWHARQLASQPASSSWCNAAAAAAFCANPTGPARAVPVHTSSSSAIAASSSRRCGSSGRRSTECQVGNAGAAAGRAAGVNRIRHPAGRCADGGAAFEGQGAQAQVRGSIPAQLAFQAGNMPLKILQQTTNTNTGSRIQPTPTQLPNYKTKL